MYDCRLVYIVCNMGDFDTSWDIEKYHCKHESAEHWDLKREFLLAYVMYDVCDVCDMFRCRVSWVVL